MKKTTVILILFLVYANASAQKKEKSSSDALLSELADGSCKCIDSINTYNKATNQVTKEVNKCIDQGAATLQLGKKLLSINELEKISKKKDTKQQIDISINTDVNSKEYKDSYYELERYLMSNCSATKEKIAATEKQNTKSVSENKKALEFYSQGLKESKKENFKQAAAFFEKAVQEDPEFAFAWDNLGISYRRLDDYDKAIEAYSKSIAIDPNGLMPLQNIAVAYVHKNEFNNAITAYEQLAKVDNNNPEVFYGLGNVYALNLKEYEKGLDNMCKAYNLYTAQKSPYRTDAETIINMIYAEMKKTGKENVFNQILKNNNISQN